MLLQRTSRRSDIVKSGKVFGCADTGVSAIM